MAISVPVLKLQGNNVLFPLLGIYLLLRHREYLQKISALQSSDQKSNS